MKRAQSNNVFQPTVLASLRSARPAAEHGRWASLGNAMRITSALLLACISAACAVAQPIEAVVVRNANFEVTKKLGPDELRDFERQWNAKEATELGPDTPRSQLGGEHFKLDIDTEKSGHRWLYYSTGYVQLLAIKGNITIYKVIEPESFNRLMGVTK